MNYIRHLTVFYEKMAIDNRFNPSHVSLYLALFQCWNMNHFENPISINRMQVLQLSKIGSEHTYYRDLNDLNNWGYIEYLPSRNPMKGSFVNICIFDISSAVLNQNTTANMQFSDCKNNISTAQVVQPSLNNINILNNKTYIEENAQNEIQKFKPLKMKNSKGKKVATKKENNFVQPTIEEVTTFFKSENQSELEARKFFNHFESNGWRVGGKSPMKNWNAAARNWMLNSQHFIAPQGFPKPQQTPKPNPNNKNYAEPL